jgi:hypothetical protein
LPFFDRFEIRSIVSQRCLRARDKVTGLNVLVHVVSPDPELAPLLKRRALLVCEGSQEGVDYAATPDREDLLDLLAWKGTQRVPPDLLTKAPPKVSDKPAASGDFTVMFRVPNAAQYQGPPAGSEPPQTPTEESASEFTAMFRAPGPKPVVNDATVAQPAQPASESAGEFTSMFRAPVAPAETVRAEPPEPQQSGDEFTAMFRTPPAPADTQVNKAPAPSKPAEVVIRPPGPAAESIAATPEPQPSAAGEFTAVFRTPAPAQTPPKAPESKPAAAAFAQGAQEGGSEFTAMFRTPPPPTVTQTVRTTQPADIVSGPAPVADSEATRVFSSIPEAPPSSVPPAQAPGEFTRLFQAPGPSAGPARPVQPASPAPSSDFDRFFNAPYSSDPEAEKRLRGGGAPIPEGPSMLGPGDFTRVFGQKDFAGGPAAPPSATGAFATPGALGGMPSEEPMSAGPSEYTKLFQTPAAAAPASAPAPAPVPQPAPAAVQAPSKIPPILLYVVLGLLACGAIGAVLYFALRH